MRLSLVASLLAGMIMLGATAASAQQVIKLTFTDPDDPTTVPTAAAERLGVDRHEVEDLVSGQ